MTLTEKINQLKTQYEVLEIIDLNPWHDLAEFERKEWFREILSLAHRDRYDDNQRVVFTLTRGDVYPTASSSLGVLIEQFQRRLNEVDISNFFVILLTTDETIQTAYYLNYKNISSDTVPITVDVFDSQIQEKTVIPPVQPTKKVKPNLPKRFDYNSRDPLKVNLEDLSEREQFLLTESNTFCIYPWIHFHAYPTGKAYPCCMADMQFPIGDMRQNTIKEIWNQEPMRVMRQQMLNEQNVTACNRCYEQEATGFFSGRLSANKHHGHHIHRVSETKEDGTLERFELTYWDIRFSNLCNLKCRSCGHIFSSQWYQDQAQLAGPEWKKTHKVLNYAGRYETDAWEQLIEHIDHVEQIYFAGGEPLIMDEHYRILEELEKRGRFDVRLIYNTNFTQVKLKDRTVFEYWKKFDSVSVGASLDDQGARGEYIRSNTHWSDVIENRREMMRVCPNVDFYISPTLSIMNAWSLPDFHRDWVESGLIRIQDMNINMLQDPPYYRADIAPLEYKEKLIKKYQDHMKWMESHDPLRRATVGFGGAINFLQATDNTHLIEKFWQKTAELDIIRKENILEIIPELEALK